MTDDMTKRKIAEDLQEIRERMKEIVDRTERCIKDLHLLATETREGYVPDIFTIRFEEIKRDTMIMRYRISHFILTLKEKVIDAKFIETWVDFYADACEKQKKAFTFLNDLEKFYIDGEDI